MDIICLYKTYIVSSTQLDDKNLEIPGYNFVRSDHQSNHKQEEGFLYYKTLLPLRVIDICLLQECICFEIMIGEKRCTQVTSQNKGVFDSFSNNFDFELTLDKFAHNNPFLLIVIGDLNAKSERFYLLDKITYEGNKVETITSNIGLH